MNNGSWLPEEDFKGLEDNFFDNLVEHMDDIPLEDIETADDDEEEDWVTGFKNLGPPPLDVLTSLSSEFNCKEQRVRVQKSATIVKQSSSSDVSSTVDNFPPDVKVSKLFQSTSPVSVLENSNGSALSQNQNRIQRLAFLVKGTRSKRKRPTTLRFFQSLGAEMSQMFVPEESESENSAKKKRKKYRSPPQSVCNSPELFNPDGTVRKCTHCETTRTPQWREGPCGRKTLCNACGVRFRSGRLVPEYRPASSPTFVPTVHSNSHRKIIEMRRKDEGQPDTRKIRTVTS
ncbi:PREDICTED: putative GATA transcription factor 13 isoform X2 [Camelina sativa]|uniref:GATA transcription factor 13 isoform X2 n=1 Tax=Camelina sativa TaxID=90675 RepID=A0ABM0SQ99_CAMSA|nr:PREDICTED: putative GATA transcription factor 13 isoform X3 [Camelina sativa]XP_010414547.1 PREDICTED: putative GATA transcription factor 13 isoform X2 [Camelina sativa]